MIKRKWSPNAAQAVALGFAALILIGTLVLKSPLCAADPSMNTTWLEALFTATSAVCLTGLIVVDTATHWSHFGQLVILVLIQLGGFGIMSMASLVGMVITGRVSMRARMFTKAENRTLSSGQVRITLLLTLVITAVVELLVALVLGMRYFFSYDHSVGQAIWYGVFYAISAFNNAGFALDSDNLMGYVGDAWIILPISVALIIGGLGFPVISELASRMRRKIKWLRPNNALRSRKFSITTRITLVGTAVLIVSGWILVLSLEVNGALAGLSPGTKVLAAFFQGVTPRTAGFNSIDYADFHPVTLMGTDILMFIGGGSAGTAGGIKITTLFILCAAMAAEARGHEDVTYGKRTLSRNTVRQALTVFGMGILLLMISCMALEIMNPQFSTDRVVFEAISAFGTVGLSTGLTPHLTAASQLVLCALMYLGRIGPVTLVVALALHQNTRHYSYPEERPFVG
ncbi:potassium transporter TrkG [Corynebacterium caspium]|uniref:potassium transporter TrkG n=1 Tax=Corynebacterium caspium TaxID=234828 RepID=UPI000375E7E8